MARPGHLPRGPRPLPTVPMDPGEYPQVVLRGRLSAVGGAGRVVAWAEMLVGHRLGASRWIMLTTTRLLVVAPFARTGDWFDVSYDRRNVRAERPETVGGLVRVGLRTPDGPQLLRLPGKLGAEATRFARALGAPTG